MKKTDIPAPDFPSMEFVTGDDVMNELTLVAVFR